MRLARQFHRPDVDQFLSEISDRQFCEWMAADKYVDPFDDRLIELSTAALLIPHAGEDFDFEGFALSFRKRDEEKETEASEDDCALFDAGLLRILSPCGYYTQA